MATLEQWNAYINVVHELALVEDDLRTSLDDSGDLLAVEVVDRILFERFGQS